MFLYGSHFRVGGRAAVLIFLIEVRAGALVQIKTQAIAFLIGQAPLLPGIVFDPELPPVQGKSKAAIRQAPPKALTISTMQRSTERKSYFQR